MTPQNDYKLMEWTPDRIKRFWDWQSRYPEQYFTHLFGRRIAHSLKAYLRNRDVLDYGCGIGAFLPHLCSVANRVSAADISPESVASAQKKGEIFPNFLGAFLLEELLERKQQFETVISIEVIEHLDDYSLDQFLSSMRMLIKHRGTFIITTPNDEDLTRNYVICPNTGEVFHRWQHLRSWSPTSLTRRLENAGFLISQIVTTDLALSRIFSPTRLMNTIHRLRYGPIKPPHLVCVGTVR
jgi:2-polyprenyl-3-methyl-5-hydroxy-6-metoxy-1,4-benzoquinol methylase